MAQKSSSTYFHCGPRQIYTIIMSH